VLHVATFVQSALQEGFVCLTPIGAELRLEISEYNFGRLVNHNTKHRIPVALEEYYNSVMKSRLREACDWMRYKDHTICDIGRRAQLNGIINMRRARIKEASTHDRIAGAQRKAHPAYRREPKIARIEAALQQRIDSAALDSSHRRGGRSVVLAAIESRDHAVDARFDIISICCARYLMREWNVRRLP
jgi:hypothetical protein